MFCASVRAATLIQVQTVGSFDNCGVCYSFWNGGGVLIEFLLEKQGGWERRDLKVQVGPSSATTTQLVYWHCLAPLGAFAVEKEGTTRVVISQIKKTAFQISRDARNPTKKTRTP